MRSNAHLQGEFGVVLREVRQPGDEALLQAWRENGRRLSARRVAGDRPGQGRLRLRHHGFRLVAIERFGLMGHLARCRQLDGATAPA